MTSAINVRRIAAACVAFVAAAAMMLGAVGEAQANYEVDTSGMFEFKLGPYHPMVDQEFGDDGPYEAFFGNRSMFYGEISYDYHLWREFGTLSVGLHAGYGRVSATMVDEEGTEVDSDDLSALRNIPLKTSLVYRYDYSAHNHNIPLVPVVKAGLNYNFWRATDASGDTQEIDGQRGVGGTAGIHATLGLHLHLDFFDPRRSASMSYLWGVQNTFLFAEYNWTRTDVFGDGINLGSNHWAAGLAFEF